MKTKYLSLQFKQFALASVFVTVAALGLTVTNSFNSAHIAKLEADQTSPSIKKLVDGKEAVKKKDTFYAAN